MNRSSFAFFVALLIHTLLLLLFWLLGTLTPPIKEEKPKEKKIKISLKEMPKKVKEQGQEKREKSPPPLQAPPMPKGEQLKKVVEPKKIKLEPTKAVIKPKLNPPKKVEPKAEPKPKVAPLPPTKPYIPLLPKVEKPTPKAEPIKESDPMAWLSEDKTKSEVQEKKSPVSSGSNISNNIKELYGDTFGKLSAGQQKYILNNQEIMRRITQQVLNRVARVNLPRDLNVNRSNVIEFYLHPNGDMSDFKFLSKSGYYVLDDTTKETIEYAYSRYPRPSEKTLIRYNVYYKLAHY